jgi:hypothetical protein
MQAVADSLTLTLTLTLTTLTQSPPLPVPLPLPRTLPQADGVKRTEAVAESLAASLQRGRDRLVPP